MNIVNAPRGSRNDAESNGRLSETELQTLTHYSIIGLFVLALLAALRIAGDIVVPIFSALVVGSLLGGIIDRLARLGLAPALAGFCVLGTAVTLTALMINALIDPFSSLISQAPKMSETVAQAAARILNPLANIKNAVLHSTGAESNAVSLGDPTVWITTVLGRLTPALGELFIFLASLVFFIAGRTVLRRQLILAMPAHSSRLKAIRAFGAIENGLTVYFGATAIVYAGVAAVTALVTFACGLGNPLLWGVMTFVAAYIPYFGVTLITIALAATGALTYPQSLFALAPALAYLTVHVATELAVIPTILGRRHEINPFLIFISIVFWTWMWGPVGAVLAVPILVTMHSLMSVVSAEDTYLP